MTTDTQNATNAGPDNQGPVGQGEYEVQAGDCIESIAFEHGFLWQTLWDYPANAELKSKRSPNLLLPGDRVTIPAVRPRQANCQTDQLSKFELIGAQSHLRLRFLDDQQQPMSGVSFLLTVDGKTTKGRLDNQGSLNVPIPCNASNGSVRLQTNPPETHSLEFGHLDPDSSPTGVRGRLNNLGFACASDGDWDQDLRTAILRFQLANNLPNTGQFDDRTRQALKQGHQS